MLANARSVVFARLPGRGRYAVVARMRSSVPSSPFRSVLLTLSCE